jgi:hypothetical protein
MREEGSRRKLTARRVVTVLVETALDPEWESPIGVTLRNGWMTVTDSPTAGLDEFTRKRIRNDAPVLALWEARIRDVRVPLDDLSTPAGAAVHHFVAAGFGASEDPMLDRWRRIDTGGRVGELMFRIPWTDPVGGGLAEVGELAAASGTRAVAVIELPRRSESAMFDDDDAVADRVAAAARGASSEPDVAVYLDGFMDHDRGYYPRHGLIGRSFNARSALCRLTDLSSGRG